jgi:hypothetical protein
MVDAPYAKGRLVFMWGHAGPWVTPDDVHRFVSNPVGKLWWAIEVRDHKRAALREVRASGVIPLAQEARLRNGAGEEARP